MKEENYYDKNQTDESRKKKKSTMHRILLCIRPYLPLVILSLLLAVVSVALQLLVPI